MPDRFLLLLLITTMAVDTYSAVTTVPVTVPTCDGQPPGDQSCYYQLMFDPTECTALNPCRRLLVYFGGGEQEVPSGKLDIIGQYWAAQGYATALAQPFADSSGSAAQPLFEQYERLAYIVTAVRNFYTTEGLWTGEYLVIGGVSEGATGPPMSIANQAGFRTAPDVWTGSVSTAMVLFDGYSSSASWEAWLGAQTDDLTCQALHARAVNRYGDGIPLQHSCNNQKCFCSDPPSAANWAYDTVALNSVSPVSPYTCDSMSADSKTVNWFIMSCEGAGKSPCDRMGDVVPTSEQTQLAQSLQGCPGVVVEYTVSEDCGHGQCGALLCGANRARVWLDQIWNDCSAQEASLCHRSCAPCMCSGRGADQCTDCPSGRYLNLPPVSEEAEERGPCLFFCRDGWYESGLTRTCLECNTACDACYGPSAAECFACADGFFLSGNSCSVDCPKGTFKTNMGHQCAVCPHACTACDDFTTCTECEADRLFYEDSCLINCPSETYEDNGQCLDCDVSCKECSGSATTCTKCEGAGVFLNYESNMCGSGALCPSLTFADPATNTCVPCNQRCAIGCTGRLRSDCSD